MNLGENPELAALREFFGTAQLPETLRPAPHLHITDVRKFVETQLARLDSDSKLIRELARLNLLALKNKLSE